MIERENGQRALTCLTRPPLRAGALLLLASLFLGGSAGEGLASGGPSGGAPLEEGCGRIVPSSYGGVAPFLFQVYADYARDPGEGRGFLHYDYEWDFGDQTCGDWGLTGRPRNSARGAAAGHVYERAGTYTASLTVRGRSGILFRDFYSVRVQDPDQVYPGKSTICVADSAHPDFPEAPAGSLHIVTDDLREVTKYAGPGRRILLRRGGRWTVSGLEWEGNGGPVTIGAFGPAEGRDELGIAGNAPRIKVVGGKFLNLDGKQGWRVMDLHLSDPSGRYDSVGGAMDMQDLLFLRLRIEGFSTCLGWSHWNSSKLKTLDRLAVVSCDLSGGRDNIAYVGGERLALLGNRMRDAQLSHVLRVWQAYMSVISDNQVSGASLQSPDGRHALKLHGPGFSSFQGVNEYGAPRPDTGLLARRTEFVVVSDNVFGSSGPWPVAIGPQDDLTDSGLSRIVFERNRIVSDYGSQGGRKVAVGLWLWASDSVVRNNILDGSGSGKDYTGIAVDRRGVEPSPAGVEIYHNTIYRADNRTGNQRIGIAIGRAASRTVIKNNLISFPDAAVALAPIEDLGQLTEEAGNRELGGAAFEAPSGGDPLERDFRLKARSGMEGEAAPVFDDFSGATRGAGDLTIGALQESAH